MEKEGDPPSADLLFKWLQRPGLDQVEARSLEFCSVLTWVAVAQVLDCSLVLSRAQC